MDFSSDCSMTIDGGPADSEAWFDVINPASGTPFARAPDCSRAQLDAAVAASAKAFPAWSATPIEQRRIGLVALADSILEHREALARLLTSEQGKPHAAAKQEIVGAARYLKGFSTLELPVTVTDTEDGSGRYIEARHVPLGVVGGMVSWNFPVSLSMFKVAPALLAGNALVLKPSPFTPLTTLRIGELAREIFPAGVFNVISGGNDLGPWMSSHPGFAKISFTGSTQAGRRVMASAAHDLKRVTLELGGNDAAIVLPDVDVKTVAGPLFWSAFANSGQICIATKRMYIHEAVYEPLKNALVEYGKTVKVGDGAEQGSQLGPINNLPQYERVLELIADAKAKGYKFALGGEPIDGPGYFVGVTMIDNPPMDSRIVQEEQFGPVLPLIKYRDIDEVVAEVNTSDYGLGGSVWSADEERAVAVARRLETGNVWINDIQYLSPLASFGGQKQSGIGVEGGLGGLLEYTAVQSIFRTTTHVGQ